MMKWLFYCLLMLLPIGAMAQTDLAVAKVLDGRYKQNAHTTDVEITSKRLADYRLNYYHCLTIESDTTLMNIVAEAFSIDQQKAIDKELSQVGTHIYYGFCMMYNDDSESHYLFFKDMRYAPTHPAPTVTLIYMEGPATMQYLKKRFKKN